MKRAQIALACVLCTAMPGIPFSIQAAPEWAGDMPWFDNPRDDYREYKPEDLKLKKQGQRPPMSMPRAGFDPSLLFYAVAALLIGVLIYFILRYLANRQPGEEAALEGEAIEIQVVDLPEAKLPDRDLRLAIDELIAQGNFRRAGMLLFQLVCNQFRVKNLLEVTQDQTPREIRRAFSGQPAHAGLLSDAVHVFEDCAYRPVEVESNRVTSLRERVFQFCEQD
jgi:hypothetical protein